MSKNAPFHACTTATRAQLPPVRVLCASVLAEHPDAEITVLLVDGDEASADAPEFRLITPDAVGLPTGVFRINQNSTRMASCSTRGSRAAVY